MELCVHTCTTSRTHLSEHDGRERAVLLALRSAQGIDKQLDAGVGVVLLQLLEHALSMLAQVIVRDQQLSDQALKARPAAEQGLHLLGGHLPATCKADPTLPAE